MFAMTWSAPRAVKAMVGNQIEIILDAISRDEVDRKTAIVTSQLAKMARRKIWCQAGVTTLAVAKEITSALKAPALKTPPSVIESVC